MRFLVLPICVVMSFSFLTAASSQAIVKKEPARGTMGPADFVYLDDGSCPKGQLMKVSGGAQAGGGRNGRGVAQPRPHECVPHP